MQGMEGPMESGELLRRGLEQQFHLIGRFDRPLPSVVGAHRQQADAGHQALLQQGPGQGVGPLGGGLGGEHHADRAIKPIARAAGCRPGLRGLESRHPIGGRGSRGKGGGRRLAVSWFHAPRPLRSPPLWPPQAIQQALDAVALQARRLWRPLQQQQGQAEFGGQAVPKLLRDPTRAATEHRLDSPTPAQGPLD